MLIKSLFVSLYLVLPTTDGNFSANQISSDLTVYGACIRSHDFGPKAEVWGLAFSRKAVDKKLEFEYKKVDCQEIEKNSPPAKP